MRNFGVYLRSQARTGALAAGLLALFALCGWLGGLEGWLLLYFLLLGAVLCALALGLGYVRFLRRRRLLEEARWKLLIAPDALPQPESPLEEDYRALLDLALADRARLLRETDRRYRELRDTFTLWAHQIKNPIAAMGLILQQEPPENAGELEQELFEIEQYVELVLNFLRLDSESTDLVLRRCRLDGIVREAVKKYAGQFIRRRLRLDYAGTELRVLTDEKWLGFVLEQLISNALKYTPKGTIRISTGEGSLTVEDTGIGIAPEDLPRVFEKGYTGYNGRTDTRSTGIGLWLCKRVLNQLGHEISIRSDPGRGTAVTIVFPQDGPEPERRKQLT